MSIDKALFQFWMGVLQDRAGRKLEAPTIRALYAILDSELETAEFDAACNAWLGQSAFLPTPAELVALVPQRATREHTEAEDDLKIVLRAVNDIAPAGIGRRERELTLERHASAHGVAAYRAVGGFEVIRGLQSADDTLGTRASGYPFVRKEYLAAWRTSAAAERQQRALQHPAMAALRAGGQGELVAAARNPLLTAGGE